MSKAEREDGTSTSLANDQSNAPELQLTSRTKDVPGGSTMHSPIKIRIEPIALVTQECITLTSAMRKHARWAQSSVSAILGGGPSTSSLATPDTNISRRSSSRGATPKIDPTGGKRSVDTVRPLVDEDTTLASRWGLRGKKGKSVQDNPLLSAFAKLRRDLATCRNIDTFDAPALLHPFLQVIRSSSTSATITSLAVMSITKFFNYNLITIRSPRVAVAMHLLSAAITHCRFEASDTAADEVVLLRILRLMELIVSRPEGSQLGDESICEMMSTGLSMCCQTRLSEVLRRSAEIAMITMCQIVFGRLADLEIEEIPTQPTARSRSNTIMSTVAASDEMKIQPSMDGSVMGNGQEPRPSTGDIASYDGQAKPEIAVNGAQERLADVDDQSEDEVPSPYSLPSIRELFRVLIDLLDPHNKQHTNVMRVMALRIIDVALEVAGPSIAQQPTLAVLVEDDLCRHIFQLVKTEDMVLLNGSLRVAGTLLTTCRKLLKLQQETFLSYLVACLHPKVDIPQEPGIDPSLYEGVPQAPKLVKPAPSQPSSGRSTPVPVKDRRQLGLEGGQRRPEAREAMVETIGTLVRLPAFMAELFVNYDCDVDRQDLCEDMVGLLSRNAFPDAATWSTTNVPPLCLDSLLTFIEFMADRSEQPVAQNVSSRIPMLREQRRRKKLIRSGATKFNDNPKGGIAFLVKHGIIEDAENPAKIAEFLKSTTHVSKKMLGEFITKKNNEELLKAFISMFNFRDKRIDEALRDLLTSFRLPGESALIERIVQVFVDKYMNSDVPEGIADQDAAYVLTYAIIMLNTDLFNPNVKKTQKRMTVDDFSRNLRGCNGGQDFDKQYLQDIYDAISQNEIILPEEHENKNAFDHAWKMLLLNTHTAGKLELFDSNAFDAEMFNATWPPIIATLCYVFMSASDDAVFSRIVVGFDQCAQLAATYDIPAAFDRIVYSLSQISTLAAEIPPSTSLNTEVQDDNGKIMVSEMAVRLGRDYRAQLSTVLLFRALMGHEKAVGETWVYVVRILRNLFVNALISLPEVASQHLTNIGPIPLQPPSQILDKDGKLAESGLFSTLSSYLSSYAADDPPEPSQEEIDNSRESVKCVKACKIDFVLANLSSLPTGQLEKLVNALLSEMPDAPSPVVVVKPDVRPAPVTARVNGSRSARNGPEYDPGSVFLLELATRLALRDRETLAATGEVVTTALQAAVRNAANVHPLATSRFVHYLLDLLRHGFEHDFMRAPVVLHAISSFNDAVLDQTAGAVVQGLTACIALPGPLRAETIASPDFWTILQRLHQHKTEADNVFAILEKLTQDSSANDANTNKGVTSDSYAPALALATSFTTAASLPGSLIEQRRDLAHKRGQKPRPPPPEDAEIVQRALKAVTLIYALSGVAPQLIRQSALERGEAWKEYWGAVFRALAGNEGVSLNACRDVRNRGVSVLLRVLLAEDLVQEEDINARPSKPETTTADNSDEPIEGTNEWTAIFSEVLFPLVARLLKPEVHKADPVGMGETRTIMVTVLCKVFLRYFEILARVPGRSVVHDATNQAGETAVGAPKQLGEKRTEYVLVRAWIGVLELLDRLLNAGVGTKEGEAVEEAVAEGVKNVLLVLGDTGYIANPKNDSGGDEMRMQLWLATQKRLNLMLPGLMDQIFSPPPPPPKPDAEKEEP